MNLKWGTFKLIDGDFISEFAKKYGEWSELEVVLFRKLLQEDDNVIEVGSNIGMHAVPIAQFISKGKLFCFEPQRIIFQHLNCNIALNQLRNVFTYNQGVADYRSIIEIESSDYTTPWNYGSFSIDKGFSTENAFSGKVSKEFVNVIDLDSHLEIQKLDKLKLLKIDAEGFDLKVIAGAKQLLERHQPIIFIEVHRHSWKTIYQRLTSLNYDCYWFISKRYQKNNFFNNPNEVDGVDMNFLCLHKSVSAELSKQLKFLIQVNLENENVGLVTAD